MTREEAIKHGKEQLEIFGGTHREFIEMSIKALEQPAYTSQIAQKAYEDGKKDGYVQAKLEQEPTIRNCVGCKYSKDNHNAGTEECHLCMWENQYTPTTENDLGVDCISREDALMCLTGKFENREYEPSELIKMSARRIKALPSVTPQEPRWILTSKKIPNKNQWVLVTTGDYQKIAEVMCYQGIRIGQHDVGNGWEEYEYPSWTSGYGDIQSRHPKAWMPLPAPFEPQESEDKE